MFLTLRLAVAAFAEFMASEDPCLQVEDCHSPDRAGPVK